MSLYGSANLRDLGYSGRATLAKVALIAAIEAVVIPAYIGREAPNHYLLHPFIALASAFPLLVAARASGWKTREEILFSYALMNFARFPDYLFQAGIEHREWMNVFLLHVAFDEIINPALIFLGAQVAILMIAYAVLKLDTSRADSRRPRIPDHA